MEVIPGDSVMHHAAGMAHAHRKRETPRTAFETIQISIFGPTKANSKPHRMSPIRSRLAVFATAVAVFIFLSYVVLPTPPPAPFTSQSTAGQLSTTPRPPPTEAENAVHVSAGLLGGNAIMPHLGNETIKSVPPPSPSFPCK